MCARMKLVRHRPRSYELRFGEWGPRRTTHRRSPVGSGLGSANESLRMEGAEREDTVASRCAGSPCDLGPPAGDRSAAAESPSEHRPPSFQMFLSQRGSHASIR